MIVPIVTALIGLGIGVAFGYLVTYRYKAQYEIAQRQLANLRGENYRGEVATIPFSATPASSEKSDFVAIAPATRAESSEICERCAELEQELVEARQVSDQDSEAISEEPIVGGTEQWQLAQLHREQVAMQISLDEHQIQVKELSVELESVRARSNLDLDQLRGLLGEHEATIASLEREKASLLDQLPQVDPPVQEN
ncbi:MAG: hypothetical protein GY768_01330 [Planctomycetaceae bacterium]|nr:hypothetical protein [Planctomycetaceae bacterium]